MNSHLRIHSMINRAPRSLHINDDNINATFERISFDSSLRILNASSRRHNRRRDSDASSSAKSIASAVSALSNASTTSVRSIYDDDEQEQDLSVMIDRILADGYQ